MDILFMISQCSIQGNKKSTEILKQLRKYNENLPQNEKFILPETIKKYSFDIQFKGFSECLSVSCLDPNIYCETLIFDNVECDGNILGIHGYEDLNEKKMNDFESLVKEIKRVQKLLNGSS